MAKIIHREASTKKLSKGLLEMKFMKRSKEKVERELEAQETESLFAVPSKMKLGTKFIIEPSYIPCEDLIVGRMSFKGMNPDIEMIMQKELEAKLKAQKGAVKVKMEDDTDVTEQEMAQTYTNNSLVLTTANKFKTKRQKSEGNQPSRNKKKYVFLKPQD